MYPTEARALTCALLAWLLLPRAALAPRMCEARGPWRLRMEQVHGCVTGSDLVVARA